MGKNRHVRVGNYLRGQAAIARHAREKSAAKTTEKPQQTPDAQPAKVEEKPGYARLLARLDNDNGRKK